jgi:type II secretory pathway component PulK
VKPSLTYDRACSTIPRGSGGNRVSPGIRTPGLPGSAAARRQHASILVIVLWIVFGLISITIYFAESMTSEFRASDARVAGIQSELAIEGARRYLTCVLSNLTDPGSLPDPSTYQNAGARVGDARFWLVGRSNAPTSISATTPIAFGFIDEASKLNLNYASSNMLIMLPGMTSDLAASILTWRSTNTSSTSGGAESDTYMRLNPPYLCKNAPFETVDELRLINNMTMDILYGEDANLNGILDPNENDGDKLPPADNQDGLLNPGIAEYLTVYTREPGADTNGVPRFNVTNYNPGDSTSQSNLVSLLGTNNLPQADANQIRNRINTYVRGGGTIRSTLQFYTVSGMSAADFVKIEPLIRGATLSGLVNINTASATVLTCILPNNDIGTANQIITYRQANGSSTDNLTSVAWLSQAVDQATALAMGPYITGRSYQYMADVAAVGANGRGYRRTRFIFDLGTGTPKILYRQDLSHLGWALGKQIRETNFVATATP